MKHRDQSLRRGLTRGGSRPGVGERPGTTWISTKSTRIALVVALLAIGATLRLIYAYGLPADLDDVIRLSEARKISLMPGSFYLPMTGPDKRHPGLCTWLAALANWLGRGNVFALRAFFVLLHVAGLAGLFLLTRVLFGWRAAVVALALAVIDRFLIAWSVQMLEPGFFFLAPWVLYVSWRCVHSPFRGCWIVLGALSATAFLYYELALFLAFPVAFVLVSSPAGRRSLRGTGPYVAGGIVLLVVGLQETWNMTHDVGTLRYTTAVLGSHSVLSFSPRVLLLYIGDLLICLKESSSVVLMWGSDLYLPIRIPCAWPAGLVYLACVAWSFRFWRDATVSLLLVGFFSVALPLSLFLPRDRWNDFHYAGQTVMLAIVLTAWVADRALASRIARVAVGAFFLVMTASSLVFLSGPKWGYFTPDREKAYLGEVFYYRQRHGWGENGLTDEDVDAIRRLTAETIRVRPDSLVAQYYRARFAASDTERLDALRRAKTIAPHSPAIATLEASFLEESGDLIGARDRLKAAEFEEGASPAVRSQLVGVEYALGNYLEAAKQAEWVATVRPTNADIRKILFFSYDALGQTDAARRAFDSFRYWSRRSLWDADLYIAQEFVRQGKIDKAAPLVEEAFRLEPQSPETQFALGVVMVGQGKIDRAEELLRSVLRADPTHAQARALLEEIAKTKEGARNATPPESQARDEGPQQR